MSNELLKKLRNQQYAIILKSPEYKVILSEIVKKIKIEAKSSHNEASIESYFDCELFSFFQNIFKPLGYDYKPIKEAPISTKRHISKGRADSAIGAVIIEFKHHSKLTSEKDRLNAVNQISVYLNGIYAENYNDVLGFITDGVFCCFVGQYKGVVTVEKFHELDYLSLDRLIKNIISLELTALTAKNLVKDFCLPNPDISIAFELVHNLFSVLKNNIHPKTKMLFDEWKELFKLAHDDVSKQQAIINRTNSLEKVVNVKFSRNEEEYLALYALQTAYAIIIKIIAFKVVSKIKYSLNLINFESLAVADSYTLRNQMSSLEDGDIFIQYGITNLLEGDFFSWYTSEYQWNDSIADSIKKIFIVLNRYEDRAVLTIPEKSQDFFKELYIEMIPDAVRHSLGEYYTKKWLARQVVDEAIELCGNINWKGLDPCCGSGTFITAMIDKLMVEIKQKTKEQQLFEIINRIKGIDLNPVTVLTARVNYFINIAHLIEDDSLIEIPIYLGDSSYVPQKVIFDGVKCLQYSINTLLYPIEILVPQSMVKDPVLFSHAMTSIETDIKMFNVESAYEKLAKLIDKVDLTDIIKGKITAMLAALVELEKREWDGIWARIITNFLTTANLGEFDVIVGNPPWIDWKSLPSGYRERIKSLCISRKLFSGDVLTGGINLNICALISNVVAQNWLSTKGVLAFLMPEPLAFQPSYEGFRNFYLDNDERLYFKKFTNWTKAGHPFKPVTQKFLTYYFSRTAVDYKKGVPTTCFILKKGKKYNGEEEMILDEYFDTKDIMLVNCHANKTAFTYVDNEQHIDLFNLISGESYYKGREGIEFYPQELMLFMKSDMPSTPTCTSLVNYQNKKSKYKLPQRTHLLETEFLFPMIKGVDIKRFCIDAPSFIVPFPYMQDNPRVPISLEQLLKFAPNLAKHYISNKDIIKSQTNYNKRIIGKETEFYALARVGEYSYAKCSVAFRDNTKWCAAVVTEINTNWGGLKRPMFQNHAVTINQDADDNFITFDEAHYICGILNAPITSEYIMKSSDSRSYPIRPRIFIPKYNSKNQIHHEISQLSIKAHKQHDDNKFIQQIDKRLNELYLQLLEERF